MNNKAKSMTRELRLDVESVSYNIFLKLCKEKKTNVTAKIQELMLEFIEKEL